VNPCDCMKCRPGDWSCTACPSGGIPPGKIMFDTIKGNLSLLKHFRVYRMHRNCDMSCRLLSQRWDLFRSQECPSLYLSEFQSWDPLWNKWESQNESLQQSLVTTRHFRNFNFNEFDEFLSPKLTTFTPFGSRRASNFVSLQLPRRSLCTGKYE